MIAIGDQLPAFRLKGVDGEYHTNFDYADRYAVLVLFTNNTCEVSKAYRQRVLTLEKRYEEDNLGVIRVNPSGAENNEESFEEMQRLAKEIGMEHLYVHDPEQELAKMCGATVLPEAFLFNSKRELVYRGAIDDCWENEHMVTMVYLEEAIEAALDGIEVDYPEIEAYGCKIVYK